ncbi:MAG TPA: DUF1080 domain-containing protein [Roseimicrobium sp.]|nr:DUF1080 domain-containing protein [Roseimicrobium sp.]
MKSLFLLTALCALVAGCSTTSSNTNGSASSGFRPIFNGKDLSGWMGNPDLWSVQEGAITGKTLARKDDPKKSVLTHNTFLVNTNITVSDFELRFSYKIVPNNGEGFGNSGVQYRSKVITNGVFGPIVGGYQADFEAGKTYSGILYEERGRGILAKRGEKTVIKAVDKGSNAKAPDFKVEVTGATGKSEDIQANIKAENWNEYVIVAKGNHVQHFINGMQTIDVTDEDAAHAPKAGILGLQIHVGGPMTVQFKDLRIKELK